MASDENRMRKIASNLSEDDRKKQLSKSADVRRDIEETLGYDVVNQDTLVKLAAGIWNSIPVSQRSRFTAEDWQRAIHERCSSAMVRAEQKLEENKIDEKMHIAKIKTLRQTFAQQVVRAMTEVSDIYRAQAGQGSPAAKR
jgi:hypothetical protein